MKQYKNVNGEKVALTTIELAEKIELEVAWTQKHEEYLLNSKYRDDRMLAFPNIGDQLDMIYWDKINGTSVWKDLITSIKTQYPKPQ